MKKLKQWIAAALAGVLALGVLAGCGQSGGSSSGSLESIKERGTNGENQGYDVYLAKRLAKDLLGDESKVEFVLVEAASRVEYLQSNKVDLLLANFTVTKERAEQVDFANPYMKVALGIVSKDGGITSVDQLKGKTLAVNKGTTAETYFTENYPDINLLKFDQNTETFQALKDGRADALAHDNTLLFAWANENDGFEVGVSSLGSHDTIAPAVKKGNDELRSWVNDELTKLGEEKFMHKNYQETLLPYYGDDIDPEDVVVEGGALE